MQVLKSPRLLVATACVLACLGAVRAAERSPAAIADAAGKFLAGLSADQRQQITVAFDSNEREHWGFVPTEIFKRNGLTIQTMTEPQRKLPHDLLRTGLSQRGYLTTTSIMELETVLRAIEDAGGGDARPGAQRMVRDPVRYFFSVFGTPSAHGNWGWRVEGHHVSLNFTIVNGTLVGTSPSFSWQKAAEVRNGPKKGLRILAA